MPPHDRGRILHAPMSTPLPARNLDLLRAVAVSCVVIDHVAQLFTDRLGLITVWTLGRVGVLMFFVHTALVLMSSLERQRDTWSFCIRRAFRIYPLAIVAIVGFVAFHIPPSVRSLAHPTSFAPLSLSGLAANVLLVQNLVGAALPIIVLWSLPLEVQMYVTLPACYRVATRGVRPVLLLIVAAAAAWYGATRLDMPGLWRISLLSYVPCFLSGVLAFAILRGSPRRALPSWTWPLVLIGVIGLAAALKPGDENPPMNWVVCLALGLAIPFVGDARRTIATRAANVLCEYSYGIYLTHIVALWVAFVACAALPLAARFIVFTASTATLAYISYHVIERPGIVMGKRAAAWLGRRSLPWERTTAYSAPSPSSSTGASGGSSSGVV